MRIIAVWSLFARWNHSVTEAEGCSPHGLKNTSWPPGSLEIFSAERQRISRSGTFIATSEHTLNSAYNQHESRAKRSPLGWYWTEDIAKMGNGYEKKWKYVLAAPKRISLWRVEKRNATVFGTMARNQATRGVATVLLIQNRASVGLVPHGSEILL